MSLGLALLCWVVGGIVGFMYGFASWLISGAGSISAV